MTVWSNGTSNEPAVGGRYGDPRPNGRIHEGTDFIDFTYIHAIIDGVVTWAGWWNNAAGYGIAYEGRDPISGEIVEVRHFHWKANTQRIKKGDRITAGSIIATMGNTGNATGNCDHVEIRRGAGGPTRDPVSTIKAWISAKPPKKQKGVKRTAVPAGSNGRTAPRRSAKKVQFIAGGRSGGFDEYTHGENVQGNDIWFHGAKENHWFWSGGFTDRSTTGMKKV